MKFWKWTIGIIIAVVVALMIISAIFSHNRNAADIKTPAVNVSVNNQHATVDVTNGAIAGSQAMISKSYQVAAFDQVIAYNNLVLDVRISQSQQVTVTASKATLSALTVAVNHDVLAIGWAPGSDVNVSRPAVVSVTLPALQALTVFNQVDGVVTGLKAGTFNLKVYNQAKVSLQGQAASLSVNVYNNASVDASKLVAGQLAVHVYNRSNARFQATQAATVEANNFANVLLTGKADKAVFVANNFTNINAVDLMAGNVDAKAANMSHINVTARNVLDAKADNMSSIAYSGEPKQVRASAHVMSSIGKTQS